MEIEAIKYAIKIYFKHCSLQICHEIAFNSIIASNSGCSSLTPQEGFVWTNKRVWFRVVAKESDIIQLFKSIDLIDYSTYRWVLQTCNLLGWVFGQGE